MSSQAHPKTVLVVDDDPRVCEALDELLAVYGYEAIVVQDQFKALNLISQHRPSAVLLDDLMPGIQAQDFVARVRSQHALCEIILMCSTPQSAAKAKAIGVKHYVTKPIDFDQLLALLQQYTNLTASGTLIAPAVKVPESNPENKAIGR
jgi:DNA-binding NtrC family response regulator